MKVTITPTAEDSLELIYQYKCEYSVAYADDFVRKIYAFITKNLSQFPRIGHPYNASRGLFRLVYSEGFNIYYTLGEQEVFVLFIIDGSISLNQDLADPTIELPLE